MKKVILIIVPIIVLVAGAGVLISQRTSSKVAPVTPTPTVELAPIKELTETNPYGIDVTPRFDKKAVFLKISSFPLGLKTIEYELTYEAKEGPRGVLGTINYKGEDNIQREALLGTCSKNVCRYDGGVTAVKLTIVFRGDKTEKFQGSFNL